MLKKVTSAVLIVNVLFVIGCATHIHKVGNGAQGNDVMTQRQWYVLWGLVPINDVDSHTMAGGATDYEVKTEVNFVDAVISIFTGLLTVYPRSVTVTK